MPWWDWIKGKLGGKSARGGEGDGDGGSAEPRTARSPSRERAADYFEDAWLRSEHGDLAGALVAFGKAIELEPSADAWYGRGVTYCKLRRYPQAITDLNRALEREPRFPAALTERGLAYVNSGDVERGISDYDASIAVDPSYQMAYANKGSACLLMQRWAEAVPCLDLALRLKPRDANSRYHRGVAHEMLDDFSRAIRDYQGSLESNPKGELAPHAAQRLREVLTRARDIPEPERPPPEDLWTQLAPLSLEDTVADLVRKVHAEHAFFGLVTLRDGGRTYTPVYGRDGLRQRLTEIADVIGPRILELKLGQFDALFPEEVKAPPAEERSKSSRRAEDGDGEDDGEPERLVEGQEIFVLTHGERFLGVFSGNIDYHYPRLPTAIFGERPSFGRSEQTDVTRRCSSCRRDVAYFEPALEGDKLAGYACPHCSASPTEAWIEERMRPGGWSRSGFLGPSESLREVMARDEQTLSRLGVGRAQVAYALDRLLDGALRASAERIERATAKFEEELRASGMRGVPGLAALPLGFSLDDIERRLRNGGRLPAHRGTIIDGHDVFLQVYLGYQYCPFTRLRLPWSDDEPKREVIRRRVEGVVHLTSPTDRRLPCRRELSYRYANLEFLIVRRDDRQALRGSGLLVHLIRDHGFFEGAESPFRLDPEQAARVLGLLS